MIRWRSRRKHFFVLSSAGKPIYSRFGDDNIISGYMGVIQAIISFFEDNEDTLKQDRLRDFTNRQELFYANAYLCGNQRRSTISSRYFLPRRVRFTGIPSHVS